MSLRKSDGVVLSDHVEPADTVLKQILGLMFRKDVPADFAMIFDMGRDTYDAIHMLFVRMPIDVLFLDKNKRIVDIKKGLKPWTGVAFPGSRFRYAIEMPAGAVEKHKLCIGETLAW